jgi:hypothetical protein
MIPFNDLAKSYEKYIDNRGRLQKVYQGKMESLKQETKNAINEFISMELGIDEDIIVFCNSICIDKIKKMKVYWSEDLRKLLI